MNANSLKLVHKKEEAEQPNEKTNDVVRELGHRLADGWSVKVLDGWNRFVEVSRSEGGVSKTVFIFCVCHHDIEYYTDAALVTYTGSYPWRTVATFPLEPEVERKTVDLKWVVVQHTIGESAVEFEDRLYACMLSAIDTNPRYDFIYGQTLVDGDARTTCEVLIILDLDAREILPVFPGGTVIVYFDGHEVRELSVSSANGTVLLDPGTVPFDTSRIIFQRT